MPDYCVCVNFVVAREHAADFLSRAQTQARASLCEPGCRVFDVWTDAERPGQVFLYELYDGKAAFDAHLRTPHFRDFDKAVARMIEDKVVMTWSDGCLGGRP